MSNPDTRMQQTRQTYLDSMRGVAAAIVVVVHYLAAFRPYSIFGLQEGYQPQNQWELFCHTPPLSFFLSGHTAVCLFFILSGYVLSISHLRKEKDTGLLVAAAVKRPFRLGGVVLCTILLSAFIWNQGFYFNREAAGLSGSVAWLGGFWTEESESRSLLLDMLSGMFRNGVVYNPPLWTIRIELYGSLLVYLFIYLFGQHRHRLWVLAGLAIALQSTDYLGFILGMIAAVLETKTVSHQRPLLNPRISFGCLLAGLVLASYPSYASPVFRSDTIWSFLPEIRKLLGGYPMISAAFLFCGVATNERVQRCLDNSLLNYLGRISFALYAVHCIVLGSISSWMYAGLHKSLGSDAAFWVVLPTGLLINCLIASLITRFVDQPSVQFSGYLGRHVVTVLRSQQERRRLHQSATSLDAFQRDSKISA
jgi:peptidoglycan/LPS O-acetylase OafA/YrhL